MASLNEKKLPAIIAGAAIGGLVLVGGIYFALSAFASGKAEERLRELLIEAGTPYAVQWDDLSASPLGGTIKLSGVRFNLESEGWGGPTYHQFEASRAILKGFNSSEAYPNKASIRMESVEFPSVKVTGRERNALRNTVQDSPLMELALNSGRQELPPFTLEAGWTLKKNAAELKWSFEQQDMFSINGEQTLEGSVGRLLSGINMERLQSNPLQALQYIAQSAAQVGLSRFNLTAKDMGLIKRRSLLHQRYAVASRQHSKPGDATKQQQQEHARSCSEGIGEAFVNKNACERLAEFMAGERSQLVLNASASNPVTYADLDRGGLALLNLRMKPELK